MGGHAELALDEQGGVRFRDFEVVGPIPVEVEVVPQAGRWEHLQHKAVHGLMLVRDGLQMNLVETLLHGRRVGVAGAMDDTEPHESY